MLRRQAPQQAAHLNTFMHGCRVVVVFRFLGAPEQTKHKRFGCVAVGCALKCLWVGPASASRFAVCSLRDVWSRAAISGRLQHVASRGVYVLVSA